MNGTKKRFLVQSSYGMERTFFEARAMTSTACMSIKFRFPHFIQNDG